MGTDDQFKKAFEKASNIKQRLPQDIMLKLYAYYKQATLGDHSYLNEKDALIDGFKFNAWLQLKGMSSEEAKVKYIQLVETL